MAFNPFHAFRKHQKVIFAMLTIVAMITFVFCSGVSGARDIFMELIPEWVGGKVKGQKVTELYGSRVNVQDIERLRRERFVAREALQVAFRLAFSELMKQQQDLQKKPIDADRVKKEGELFTKQQKLLSSAGPVFQVLQGDRVEDLLDYSIWKHQADQLGITLTPDDVNAQLRHFMQGFTRVDDVVGELMSSPQAKSQRMRPEHIQNALASAFRVTLAQEVMLGSQPGYGPALASPYEFQKFMAEQRTELPEVALFKVPVTPSSSTEVNEKSLRALYERYKDTEPSPDRAAPGFKEPRRVRIEWIGARADDPHWAAQAEKVLPDLPNINRFLATAGGNPFVIAGLFTAADSRAQLAYESIKGDYEYRRSAWYVGQYDLPIFTARTQPAMPVCLVGDCAGAAAGMSGTGASPLTLLVNYQTIAVRQNHPELQPQVFAEAENRKHFVRTLFETCAMPNAATPFAAAALFYHRDERPAYLPLNYIRPAVEKKAQTDVARILMLSKLKAFQKELETKARGGAKDVKPWLETELKKPGITLHVEMKEAKDAHAIANDLALESLKKAYTINRFDDLKAEKFPDLFFKGQAGLYEPQPWPTDPPQFGGSTLFSWEHADEPYLFWKTEDKPAYVPPFEEAKGKVAEAWRVELARGPAGKQAERLLAQVKEADGDRARLVQIAAEHKDNLMIELSNIARRVRSFVPQPTQRGYEPYKFDMIQQANAKDWLDKLLALKKKGDAVLLEDLPRRNYYVAVLMADPKPPTALQVAEAYRSGQANSTPRDPLLSEFIAERQNKYREAVMKELRVAARAPLEDNGHYKLSEEFRKEGRDEGSDEGG